MRRAFSHLSEGGLLDRRRREAAAKRGVVHALGLLGANLLVGPPCLLGLAVGQGARLGTVLPYAFAFMALGIVMLRAAMRLLHW